MRRREFLGILGSAAVALPLAARAQSLPVIGFFINGTAHGYSAQSRAFRQGLAEAGFRDSENVTIVSRWTDGQLDRIPAMTAELVKARPSVFVTNGGTVRSIASATKIVPIVFVGGGDPVQTGLVSSFNRPGGNITGVIQFGGALGAKRLELLQQLVPQIARVSLLINPNGPTSGRVRVDVHTAAQKLGLTVGLLNAQNEQELEAAFSTLTSSPDHALLVSADPFFLSQRVRVTSLVARQRIPAMYDFRDYAEAGGLMSYGASLSEAYRQLGVYAGRIIKGEKPGDLPILQPTKFEFVINLKTAKTLGIAIPDRLLALADEVIE